MTWQSRQGVREYELPRASSANNEIFCKKSMASDISAVTRNIGVKGGFIGNLSVAEGRLAGYSGNLRDCFLRLYSVEIFGN